MVFDNATQPEPPKVICAWKVDPEFDEIVVVPETYFFSPSFDKWGLMSLFEDNQSFKDAYIFHLWESLSYSRYLNKLDEHTILTIETTYNNLAKKFLRSN